MILLIDNYDSFTYNLYQYLLLADTPVTVIRNDQMSIEDIAAMAPQGIVLSPGPGRPEEAGISIPVIQHFSGKIPLLGVCLGHQAMAIAFGGKVIQSNEIIHGKAALVFHHRKLLYKGLPLPFKAGRYHSLVVEKSTLPSELIIEAETADGLIMGMRHQEHPCFGVQFHPESVLSECGELFIKNFVELCTLPYKKA